MYTDSEASGTGERLLTSIAPGTPEKRGLGLLAETLRKCRESETTSSARGRVREKKEKKVETLGTQNKGSGRAVKMRNASLLAENGSS